MKKRTIYEMILLVILIILIIVGITLILTGRITLTNNTNSANIDKKSGPYTNYKNIKWSTTKYITGYSGNISIDDVGIVTISANNDSIQEIKEVKITTLPEKAKYVEFITRIESPEHDKLIILTENNNLYVTNEIFDYNGNLIDTIDVEKIQSNILEILKTDDDNIPNISFGGTYAGIYALTQDGNLLSVNYNSELQKFVFGLSFEECNSIKSTICVAPYTLWQITNDDYLRDSNNIQLNYILYNGNKLKVKYYFRNSASNNSNESYIISSDNKIYKLFTVGEDFDIKLELLNDKIVKTVNYKEYTVNITYTDNTSENYNLSETDSNYRYGF